MLILTKTEEDHKKVQNILSNIPTNFYYCIKELRFINHNKDSPLFNCYGVYYNNKIWITKRQNNDYSGFQRMNKLPQLDLFNYVILHEIGHNFSKIAFEKDYYLFHKKNKYIKSKLDIFYTNLKENKKLPSWYSETNKLEYISEIFALYYTANQYLREKYYTQYCFIDRYIKLYE